MTSLGSASLTFLKPVLGTSACPPRSPLCLATPLLPFSLLPHSLSLLRGQIHPPFLPTGSTSFPPPPPPLFTAPCSSQLQCPHYKQRLPRASAMTSFYSEALLLSGGWRNWHLGHCPAELLFITIHLSSLLLPGCCWGKGAVWRPLQSHRL